MNGIRKKFTAALMALAMMTGFLPTPVSAEETAEPKTYLENGGSYDLEYILSTFNIFTSGTARASHVYGPMIVGGDAGKGNDTLSVGFTFSDYDQGASSYIGGKVYPGQRATGAANTPAGCYQSEYVGTGNNVTFSGKNAFVNDSLYLYTNEKVYKTDSYVNFDDAFASIQEQSNEFYAQTTKELGVDDLKDDKYIYVEEGQFVKLSDELMELNTTRSNAGQDPITVVYVTASADASSDKNTMINIGKSGEFAMPCIHISTSVGDSGTLYPSATELNENGTALIWNVPNATKLTFSNRENGLGHVVAPQADIYNFQGTYSGCQVCRNFYGNLSEAHMQPYNAPEIKNPETPSTTTISGTKVWSDADNQDGKRPSSVTVNLFADGEKVGSAEVTEANDWKFSFSDMPIKNSETNADIVYTVTEAAVDGYTSAVTGDASAGFTITNTHTAETVSVSGTKTWNDSNNENNKRPTSITVNLLADGVKTKSVTADAAGEWKYSFTDLPKYSNGTVISYTVAEDAVDYYASSVTGYDIENTYVPEKTSVSVNKVWSDSDNNDGKRPSSVRVQLYAGDAKSGEPVTLNAANEWKYTWTDLLKEAKGSAISYTVKEVNVPDGYESSISGTADNGYTITNTHENEKTSISGTKTWDDADDQDRKRPSSITVNLLADNVKVASKTVESADNWKYDFTGLDKYSAGKEITYTVSEEQVDGYTSSINGYNITNSYTPETTSISVSKEWADANNQDGIRPESIKVQLYAGESKSGDEVELNKGNNWSYTWAKLAKKNAGADVVYTVQEVGTPVGYTSAISGTAASGFTIANTHAADTTSISVNKEWDDAENQDGVRPASVSVQLYADDVASGDAVVLNAENSWAYTWTKLAKNIAGNVIKYTVAEVNTSKEYNAEVTGTAADGYTITNTHETATTSVSGTKTWDDSSNQDGIRPDSITVNLLANGTKADSTKVTSENGWKYSFTNLPVYKDGQKVVYTVSEENVEGYTSSIDGSNITNTHNAETIEINGTKSWDDSENQDGRRPSELKVSLKANGVEVSKKTVTAENGWKYSFTDLPKFSDGKEISYTIAEETVKDYSTQINGYNLTNSYTPGKTSITVTKSWDDEENQDGIRPESIKVQLSANGTAYGETVVLNADNKWSYTWSDLDEKKSGKDIDYTVAETSNISGYTSAISGTAASGFTITNTHKTEVTEVSVAKTWSDNENQDGKRPESVSVQLYANGSASGKAVVLNAENNWGHTWTDLVKKNAGADVVYTVQEVETPEGYTSAVSGTAADGYTITNTHETATTSVSGTKTWDDSSNQDGIRPDSITVNLLADGTKADSTKVTSENGWKYSFANLPVYKGGKKVVYTVSEENVEGYTSTIDGSNITNTHKTEETEVSVTKVWKDGNNQDGLRPESVSVQLYANGTSMGDPVVLNEANSWTYTWKNLDKNHAGSTVDYSVDETNIPDGYTKKIVGSNSKGFVITNSHTPLLTSISGKKRWIDARNQDGVRPDSITVNLLADGKKVASMEATETDDWAYSFDELPKYNDGHEIVYSVIEADPGVYYGRSLGFNLVNMYQTEETAVTVTKQWNDADNQDGIRPAEIRVCLYADGVKVHGSELPLNEENAWTFTWEGLPKMSDAKKINYTVAEVNVPDGYTSKSEGTLEDGYTIVNSHTPETVSVDGTKTWNDNDDQDGIRPDSITVNLLADGTKVAEQKATAENGWKYSFDNLAKNKNGQPIVYTVTEGAVEGYSAESTGYDIVNSHTPDVTAVSGAKTWDDSGNQDGKRPEKITVRLLADGTEVNSAEVNADAEWKYSFADLAKYKNGKEIKYTVTEDAVENYSSKIDGYDITNTYAPEKTSLTVTKAWNDGNNADELRPESVKVQLYADGKAYGEPVILKEAGNWTYTWSDLNVNQKGTKVSYTVGELDVAKGYTVTISGDSVQGYILTNTHKPAEHVEKPHTPDTSDQGGLIFSSILMIMSLAAAAFCFRRLRIED